MNRQFITLIAVNLLILFIFLNNSGGDPATPTCPPPPADVVTRQNNIDLHVHVPPNQIPTTSPGYAPAPKAAPRPDIIKAFVMSSSEKRWNWTRNELIRVGLTPVLVPPVDPTSSYIEVDGRWSQNPNFGHLKKTLSNKFTHRLIMNMIALDDEIPDDGFGLIFEDDAALSKHIKPEDVPDLVRKTNELSKATLFFVGYCGPDYGDDAGEYKGIKFRHVKPQCAHAYGVKKKGAMFLYDELAVRCYGNDQRAFFGPGWYYYMDMYFKKGYDGTPSSEWPVAADVAATQWHDHFGLFYQDRERFPSEIQQ